MVLNYVFCKMDLFLIIFIFKGVVDKVILFFYIFFLLCVEILGILIRNNRDIRGIVIDGIEYKFF